MKESVLEHSKCFLFYISRNINHCTSNKTCNKQFVLTDWNKTEEVYCFVFYNMKKVSDNMRKQECKYTTQKERTKFL